MRTLCSQEFLMLCIYSITLFSLSPFNPNLIDCVLEDTLVVWHRSLGSIVPRQVGPVILSEPELQALYMKSLSA